LSIHPYTYIHAPPNYLTFSAPSLSSSPRNRCQRSTRPSARSEPCCWMIAWVTCNCRRYLRNQGPISMWVTQIGHENILYVCCTFSHPLLHVYIPWCKEAAVNSGVVASSIPPLHKYMSSVQAKLQSVLKRWKQWLSAPPPPPPPLLCYSNTHASHETVCTTHVDLRRSSKMHTSS
jgi:hypothetical protein